VRAPGLLLALAVGGLVLLLARACPPAATPRPDAPQFVVSVERGAVETVVRFADGRVRRYAASPRRIVSTLPGATELLDALGATDRLVAVSPHCDRPAQVLALPRVAVMPPSLEAIEALRPDLLVLDRTLLAGSLAELEERFAFVLPLESATLEHLATSADLLAEVLGTPRAREGAAGLRARLADARRRAAGPGGERPGVLLVGSADPLLVLGPGSLLHDLVLAAGHDNVAADLGRPSGPFSEEVVLARDPAWILTTEGALPARTLERWASVPAVRAGRVAALGDDLMRAGPRIPDALLRLAAVLRGERPPADLAGTP
jgi:iron complex transport system substrate-binding protein